MALVLDCMLRRGRGGGGRFAPEETTTVPEIFPIFRHNQPQERMVDIPRLFASLSLFDISLRIPVCSAQVPEAH